MPHATRFDTLNIGDRFTSAAVGVATYVRTAPRKAADIADRTRQFVVNPSTPVIVEEADAQPRLTLVPQRYAPTAEDLQALRVEYKRVFDATISLSRLAKRIDAGGSLDEAVGHLNDALASIDDYRARVL